MDKFDQFMQQANLQNWTLARRTDGTTKFRIQASNPNYTVDIGADTAKAAMDEVIHWIASDYPQYEGKLGSIRRTGSLVVLRGAKLGRAKHTQRKLRQTPQVGVR